MALDYLGRGGRPVGTEVREYKVNTDKNARCAWNMNATVKPVLHGDNLVISKSVQAPHGFDHTIKVSLNEQTSLEQTET